VEQDRIVLPGIVVIAKSSSNNYELDKTFEVGYKKASNTKNLIKVNKETNIFNNNNNNNKNINISNDNINPKSKQFKQNSSTNMDCTRKKERVEKQKKQATTFNSKFLKLKMSIEKVNHYDESTVIGKLKS